MGLAISDPRSFTAAQAYTDDPVPSTNYGHELDYIRNVLIQSDVYGDRFKTLFATKPARKPTLYPATNRLAQQLEEVVWCIEKGMTTKVYFVQLAGFDTHVQQNSKDPGAG